MEENLNPANQAVSPPTVVTPAPGETSIPSETKPPFGDWWKVGMLVVVGLVLAASLSYAGYQYSQKQIPPVPQPTPTSIVVATPTPDPTANWKTYANQKHRISFKYPLEWNPIPDQPALILGPKGERLGFNEDGSLMNECMEETSTSEVNIANTIFIKKTFKGIKFGAACAGNALGKREIWIQPKSKQFGLQFEYLDSNAQEAEKIFNQILSTFKFAK